MSPPPVDGAGHAGGAVLSPDGKYTPVATTRPAYLDPSSPEMRAILMKGMQEQADMDKKEAEQAHAKMNKALTDVKGCVLELRQDDLQKRPGGGKASPAAARFGATLQFQCDSDAARA